MSNNFWNQPPQNGNNPSENHNYSQPGRVLHNYLQQQQGFHQHSPTSTRTTQGPPEYSPLPPTPEQQWWPSPQNWPSAKEQEWVSNPAQKTRHEPRRISVATPIKPLILHRPGTAPLPPKSKPWKRSRTMRVATYMKHRRTRWQKARPKTGKIWASLLISFSLLIVIILSSGTAYAFGYYQTQLPRLQGLANHQIEQTTRIYDRHRTLLYELYGNGGRRTPVQYRYIPQVMQDAMISAEDHTFWTNPGIDPQGILRAGTQYIQSNSVQSGGSTITQQLVKDLTGDSQVSLINRKLPEATLAIGLTQQYSKAKILEMYFNVAPYGAQDLGIEAAAEDYFHLNPQCDQHFNCIPGIYYLNCQAAFIHHCDPMHCNNPKYCSPLLGLARASLLAGMPQNPPLYDPTLATTSSDGQKYYLGRQRDVLNEMWQLGISVQGLGPITQDIATQVEKLTAKMKFTLYTHPFYHGNQHFVKWVIQQLENQLGVEAVLTGGFNIYTTIDTNLEAYIESAVHRHLYEPEYQKLVGGYGPLNIVNNVNDAAVVVMDAKTGEVLAMDGSANWNSSQIEVSGQVNMAVQPRQPGSAIKPIVYTTAFEQGFYPGMVLPDAKTYFPIGKYGSAADCKTNSYCPNDYGKLYSNQNTTIHSAIALSRNVPAIKASLYAGVGNVINMAQRLGITTLSPQKDNNPSFALGTSAIPLIQMVGAYQVFANQGVRVPPKSILDIWDNYGHQLYHFDPTHPNGVQVISPQIAYLMTSILKDEQARYPEFLNDHDLSFLDWTLPNGTHPDVAAKTGTTEDFKDNLTVGYTPDVVVGVWAGNANDEPMTNVIGITGAAPIWHSVIERVMGGCNIDGAAIPCGNYTSPYTDRTFPQPTGLINACVSSATGLTGTGNCDLMLNGEQPQQ